MGSCISKQNSKVLSASTSQKQKNDIQDETPIGKGSIKQNNSNNQGTLGLHEIESDQKKSQQLKNDKSGNLLENQDDVTTKAGTTKLTQLNQSQNQTQNNNQKSSILQNQLEQSPFQSNSMIYSKIKSPDVIGNQNLDEDYYEPTEKPEVNRYNKAPQYVTTKSSAPQDNQIYQVTNKNFNPKTIQDFQGNYLMINVNQGISIRDIFEKYNRDFNKEQDKIYLRCKENQTILLRAISQNQVVQNKEEDIMNYLKINSKQYQNVIGVNEIAKGGESIVFRLDYAGVDEVVIKKSVNEIKEDSKEMDKQMVFTGMMSETQQLKFLKSDKYIAQVKEEIIEYDPQSQLINDYLVIVERARFSLNDLLKIWNDEDLRSRYYEFYSPEKLAYYFYQTIQILAYLHQRDVYYGDMKPHNLLVFKDQLVKVGDLGITMKLDNSIPDDQKAYFLKGLTFQEMN
eukprot:403362209